MIEPTPFKLKREESFPHPVLFPEGLRYYETLEVADEIRYELVMARLRSQDAIGQYTKQRFHLKKSRSMRGRMG